MTEYRDVQRWELRDLIRKWKAEVAAMADPQLGAQIIDCAEELEDLMKSKEGET